MGKKIKIDDMSVDELYQYAWDQWQEVGGLLERALSELEAIGTKTGNSTVAECYRAFAYFKDKQIPLLEKALTLSWGVWGTYMIRTKKRTAAERKKVRKYLDDNNQMRADIQKMLSAARSLC